jgi:hypothetical protein
MLNKNEAEKILRAAGGGALPDAGDSLVWAGNQGWLFIPQLHIGAKIFRSTLAGPITISVPQSAGAGDPSNSKLLGGVDDVWETVDYQKIFIPVWRDNTGATAKIPNGEVVAPAKLTGIIQLNILINFSGTGNQTLYFYLGARKEDGTIDYSTPTVISTQDTTVQIIENFQATSAGALGLYLESPSAGVSITIDEANLSLEYRGL